MKKIILMALISVFFIPHIVAQWRITPEVGATYSFQEYKNAALGAQIGAAVRYSFNGKDSGFGLQTGLYFTQRNTLHKAAAVLCLKDELTGIKSHVYLSSGQKINPFTHNAFGSNVITEDTKIEEVMVYSSEQYLNYIQLPIMALYSWKFAKDYRLQVALGPYLAMGVCGADNRHDTTWRLDAAPKVSNETYNPFKGIKDRFDMGGMAQVGFEVKNVSLQLKYNTNLLYKDKGSVSHTVAVAVGYTF